WAYATSVSQHRGSLKASLGRPPLMMLRPTLLVVNQGLRTGCAVSPVPCRPHVPSPAAAGQMSTPLAPDLLAFSSLPGSGRGARVASDRRNLPPRSPSAVLASLYGRGFSRGSVLILGRREASREQRPNAIDSDEEDERNPQARRDLQSTA